MIERIAITSREQWLAARQQDITASVAGALLGVHPYATAYGLHLLKSGQVDDDVEDSPILRRGRLLEPVAVQMLREDRPEWKLDEYPVGVYLRDPVARLGATPDVTFTDEQGRRGVCQIKTVEPSVFRRDWKSDNGAVEPPLWIVVQAIVEAHLTGAEVAYVAPMVVSFGVEMPIIEIPIHAGIIAKIAIEVAKFWERIAANTPPAPDYGRDGELIARLYAADNGSTVDLTSDNRAPILVDELAAVKAEIKAAETRKEEITNEIKAKLGENTFGRLGDGRAISWKLQHRKESYVKASSFRVLRIVNG